MRYNSGLQDGLRLCSKCGATKPIGDFHRNGYGLRADCKDCVRQYRQEHRDVVYAANNAYRAQNIEKVRGWEARYKELNPDKVKAWRDIMYKRQRLLAMLIIAQTYEDDLPRCRIDLTPNTPVSGLPCRGRLTIDHMNGGGGKETRTALGLFKDIIDGVRDVSDLRILCTLHQLWNQITEEDGIL